MKSAAVIGCGKYVEGKVGWAIGHAHAGAYLQAFPDIVLYGVDINDENLAAFGEQFGVPEERLFRSTQALYDTVTPDAVSVCTWPGLHHGQVIEAAQAGARAITCEKPMALDGSEIDEMIAACRQNNARLAIAHQRRYSPVFVEARRLIQEGVLGEVWEVQGRIGGGWDMFSWTTHWFDMACFLLDDEPVSVLAGVDHTGERLYGHAVENESIVMIEYAKGARGIFATTRAASPIGEVVQVVGEKGLLRVGDGMEAVQVINDRGVQACPPRDTENPGFVGLFKELWQSVTDPSVDVRCGVEHAATATRTALAAEESARVMKKLALPPTNLGYAPLEVVQHPPIKRRLAGRAVVLADPHFAPEQGKSGRDGVCDALSACGVKEVVMVPVESREPTAEDLAGADLLVIYHTQRESSPTVRELIGGWIESGRPTVIAHCGIGAYSDWPKYREYAGIYWVWGDEDLPPSHHPHVPCELRVTPDSGFDPGFESAWLPRDEVYMNLGQCSPVTDLVVGKTVSGDAPIAWQSQRNPNVAVWAPGHRYDIWQLPVMHDGLRAIIDRVMPFGRSAD